MPTTDGQPVDWAKPLIVQKQTYQGTLYICNHSLATPNRKIYKKNKHNDRLLTLSKKTGHTAIAVTVIPRESTIRRLNLVKPKSLIFNLDTNVSSYRSPIMPLINRP